MEQLLTIISKWEPIGQGIFFLFVLTMLIGSMYNGMFYLSVILRGWPTRDQVSSPEDDE